MFDLTVEKNFSWLLCLSEIFSLSPTTLWVHMCVYKCYNSYLFHHVLTPCHYKVFIFTGCINFLFLQKVQDILLEYIICFVHLCILILQLWLCYILKLSNNPHLVTFVLIFFHFFPSPFFFDSSHFFTSLFMKFLFNHL